MAPTPKRVQNYANIVVRGVFSLPQLSPKWLADQGLVGETDALAIDVTTRLPKELVILSGAWFELQAQPDVLDFKTKSEEEFERLRDLAVGLIRSSITSKVGALGLNLMVHVQMADKTRLDQIGDTFAANDIWRDKLSFPVLREIISWGARTDGFGGRVQVQIEPSTKFPTSVAVGINDHFNLTLREDAPTSRDDPSFLMTELVESTEQKKEVAIRILSDEWTNSLQRADELVDFVVSKGTL